MPIQLIRFVLVPCLLVAAGIYLYVYLKRTAAFWKLNVQHLGHTRFGCTLPDCLLLVYGTYPGTG